MTYKLLEQAPKDHNSDEFLVFLRENNEVVFEDPWWLVIKNCKYDWLTAFAKNEQGGLINLMEKYGHLEWKVKPKEKRTVDRFHMHFIDKPTP